MLESLIHTLSFVQRYTRQLPFLMICQCQKTTLLLSTLVVRGSNTNQSLVLDIQISLARMPAIGEAHQG